MISQFTLQSDKKFVETERERREGTLTKGRDTMESNKPRTKSMERMTKLRQRCTVKSSSELTEPDSEKPYINQ